MKLTAANIPVSLDALLPENPSLLKAEVAQAIGAAAEKISQLSLTKKSIDARKKSNVHAVISCTVEFDCGPDATVETLAAAGDLHPTKGVNVSAFKPATRLEVPDLSAAYDAFEIQRPLVVGTGPAGLFAALTLARAGLRPLALERGQDVDARAKTVEAFNNGAPLNTSSNIQFGEGGAGTFSDGKLNTGTKSPHIRHVLEEFVAAGAPADILVDAKPHIGTDYLPTIVKNIRLEIERLGGKVLFDTQLVELGLSDAEACSDTPASAAEAVLPDKRVAFAIIENVNTHARQKIPVEQVVLACGHSARDTFEMLRALGFKMERKPFAVGVRIEHSQSQINAAQYGAAANHPALGAADYKLAHHNADGRGVYTFCMCPGGSVVAAASEQGGVCVNGMSNHARNGQNANSALLVEVRPDDLAGTDPLEGVRFQRSLERAAYVAGGKTYKAPAQTVGSFMSAHSANNGEVRKHSHVNNQGVTPTYPRGVVASDLHECLPQVVTSAIAEALPALDKKLAGFANPAAIMTAVEARSSSPVRIVRNKQTLESVSVSGVFPAGEGAGYAGGITSAAVDGIRVAQSIISAIQRRCVKRAAQTLNFDQAASHLKSGGALLFPTDTVFGLGVAALPANTPDVLFQLKNRAQNKPVAWLIARAQDLEKYGQDVPDYALELAEQGWPGALTLIVKASKAVPSQFSSAQGTIGLRVPDSAIVCNLIEAVGAPLATTSANISGAPAAAQVENLPLELVSQVPVLAEDPALLSAQSAAARPTASGLAEPSPAPTPKASTVIDCTGPAPKILRP